MVRRVFDLHQLRIFVRIAESDSLTRAAAQIGITQPSASRIVKELEEAWGGRLFHRTGRGVTPTELGEMALARARALLRDADLITEELRAFGRLPSGTVSLGLSPSLVPLIVPDLLNNLRRSAPDIRLKIHEGFSDQVERLRLAGDVDVGIYSKFHDGEVADARALFVSTMVLAAPSSMPALPERIDFADLGKYRLVMPAAPNGLRTTFETIARRMQVSLDVMIDTASVTAQNEICEHCGCYMIKALEAVSDAAGRARFTSAQIVNPTVQREIVLHTTQQRPLSRAAREVVAEVGAILGRLSRRDALPTH
jgi:LysR family transcriptional regulator, nitrogen assimilation regulatory protein